MGQRLDSMMIDSVIICDREHAQPQDGLIVVVWQGFVDHKRDDFISIPSLIEENADLLKQRYLSFVYELGRHVIQGKRVIEWLELRSGFSYWWMTLVAEKCNWSKSRQLPDAVRMLAFDHWAKDKNISTIRLESPNKMLLESMRLWCEAHNITFEYRLIKKRDDSSDFRKLFYKALPYPAQAMGHLLMYLIKRWPLHGVGVERWRNSEACMTFISYFFNLVPDAARKGCYQSRFWANLPDFLEKEHIRTNWLHIYVEDTLLPSAKHAAALIEKFNSSKGSRQVHVTLDSFLSIETILRTLRDWFAVSIVGLRLRNKIRSAAGESSYLWPFVADDYRLSMYGPPAQNNLLFFNLFENAVGIMPQQDCGVFLQENQPWEFAFISLWNSFGHKYLIGTPHTTVPYWDLRYFFDERSYDNQGMNSLPLPDKVAVNGPAGMHAYLAGGYPKQKMVEVEALRFLYLGQCTSDRHEHPSDPDSPVKLLVLGDYVLKNTKTQLRLLEKALPLMSIKPEISIKPHPACAINPAEYPGIAMKMVTDTISDLLKDCDVAYTSNMTSAAVDAYCSNVGVISILDPSTLNMSPIRNEEGVAFVASPEQFAQAFYKICNAGKVIKKSHDYFTIDTELPRWKKLLLDNDIQCN